jgi:hypothetical protein
MRHQSYVLKTARHAKSDSFARGHAADIFASKQDIARVLLIDAGYDIEHCGLAGPVWPDERVPGTSLDSKRDVLKNYDAAKIF